MDATFQVRVHTAAVAGWWTVLVAAAVLAVQWVAYLIVMSLRPAWVPSFWGADTTWPEMQHLWLLGTGVFKILVLVLALLCLWLTFWARQLRKGRGA